MTMHLASLWKRGLGQLGNGYWNRDSIVHWLLPSCLGNWVKFAPQNSPTMHFDTTPTILGNSNQGWSSVKPKRAIFPSLIWGEGAGGTNFSSILSKIVASCFLVQPQNRQFRKSENLLMISLQNAFGNFLCMNKQCLMLNPHRPPICNTPTEYKLSTSLDWLTPAMF